MYSKEKPYSYREEFQKARRTHKASSNHTNMPSFSSILLDEIYRSIDDGKAEGYEEKPVRISRAAKSSKGLEMVEDFRRARLVEKWMRKEGGADERVVAKGRPPLFPEVEKDSDLLFFSSTSSSSDSSGALSSSDTEFFGGGGVVKPSKGSSTDCFVSRPKPVRTGAVSGRKNDVSDDYKNDEKDEDMIKSKSRALKIYAKLKKVKQPISPGGRLTAFINSLFSNNPKSKYGDPKDSKSPSKGSSASSFSRSCLSKHSPRPMRDGVPRTVRFHPVSVIVDEDSRPCGHKSIYDEDWRPPLPNNESSRRGMKGNKVSSNVLRSYYSRRGDDDTDDGMSDSSSDLFELDNLAMFGDSRFCEELPVYETTHFHKNRE